MRTNIIIITSSLIINLILFNYSFSTDYTYTWSKETITISAEGIQYKPASNPAQDKFLIKANTRNSAYFSLLTVIIALPVDSTRSIKDLLAERSDLADKLSQWIFFHGKFSGFEYTSDSTAIVNLTIKGSQLAKLIQDMDKVIKKDKQKAVELELKKKAKIKEKSVSKDKTEHKKAGPEIVKYLSVKVEMPIDPDTTLSIIERKSKTEAFARAKSHDELITKINRAQIKEDMTFQQWFDSNPSYTDYIHEEVLKYQKISKPEWDLKNTRVTVNTLIYVNYLLKAIREADKENEEKHAKPKSTETENQK